MEHMTKPGTRWTIIDTGRGWPLAEVRYDGRPIWAGLGDKPLCGSRDSMREVAKGLRKAGWRVSVINLPNEWTPEPPVI